MGITREALAHRAGVAVGDVDRLIDAGLIIPDDADTFAGGDVWRTRFLLGLEQGGVALEAVSDVVRGGDLSFEFFDAEYWDRFGGLSDATFADVSRDTDISHALLAAVRESNGYASPSPQDRVRVDEFDAIELLKVTIASGVPPAAIEQQLRVWGENLGRIADSDASFWHEQVEVPLLESGMSQSEMLAATGALSGSVSPLLDPALLSTYHARSEHTWMAGVVEAVEATLEQAGLHQSGKHPPAMCFLDVSGYTRLTEEQGDAAAADVSTRLGELVRRGSHDRAGRPVKWLGDGVMVHFKEPAKAVGFALEMRDDVPTSGLPPVHVGIAAGPLIYQSGDYFGRTVNLASRIASYATANQVLVDDQTTQATTDGDVTFDEIGPVELKGVTLPVRLSEARRLT
ncbi:MAG TPA: adenylate/guanylate cyclase domain-containing protein [Actinomycetota bacterium]